MSDEHVINHDEAHHLAVLKQDESNLARCYLQLEADLYFVRQKLVEYATSNFDPGMMAPTLDDLRHRLLVDQQ